MTAKLTYILILILGFSCTETPEANSQVSYEDKVHQVKVSELQLLNKAEIQELFADTTLEYEICNEEGQLINTSFPPVFIQSSLFELAGLSEIVNQNPTLDVLDKDLIYGYAQKGWFERLEEKYPFIPKEKAIYLHSFTKKIKTKKQP